MAEKIRDLVVVITGASSGIGRATSHAFARNGAALLLASRDQETLQQVVEECETLGGRAIAVATDVGNERDVKDLASRALTTFGRIDVFVSNAAVSAFGRIEDVPLADCEQVIRTNLLGAINCARIVMPAFREQGSGTMIFVSSVVASTGQPFAGAYVASKWGVRGLAASLRMEVQDKPEIRVCTVLPATIDTPLFQHAANYSHRAVRAMPPVHPPEKVAEAIVDLVRHPRREVFVGAGSLLDVGRALSPALSELLMAKQVDKTHFQDRPAPKTEGNLYVPILANQMHGGWLSRRQSAKRSRMGMALAGAALFAVPVAYYAWRRSRQGKSVTYM